MYEANDYQTTIWWSHEDQAFLAQCVEIPSMMAHGDTRAAAATAIQEALECLLAWEAEEGHEVPPPARVAV